MELVVEKAYDLFQNVKSDTPNTKLGKMDTFSVAGRVELKKFVLRAKGEFDNWKKTTTDINP